MGRYLLLAFLFVLPLGLRAQDKAQPTLPTTKLMVGNVEVTAELATNNDEREAGLMFREKLATNSGMLFVMPSPQPVIFWMKNTIIPLSIAYIDPSGTILEMHDMKPQDETPIPSHFPNIAYALEMDKGWFDRNKILPGDHISGLPPLP